MGIPEEQLQRWSNQGATITPKMVRERIERALRGNLSIIRNKNNLQIFLQGSYRNNTNIFGNSDVDIVVQSNDTYFYDITYLTEYEDTAFQQAFIPASYTWSQFKNEVLKTLENEFGSSNITVGNKSIKLLINGFEADVVPSFQFRSYKKFGNYEPTTQYEEGIILFTTQDEKRVINYPKLHIKNGSMKNESAIQNFKPFVRVFKNLRNKLISNGKITKEMAPSYFIENLLYNVPSYCFHSNTYEQRAYNVLSWLDKNRFEMGGFTCQNEKVLLIGESQEQWRSINALNTIDEAIILWNEW
ncbi:nucleotidyltransferase domain-containing protein [Paenibacillus sp. FSL H3-0310]|uniref:nucleotidyltransferase domain-containing protein n=1 Tax=Paenibacillus sp. FSL H3-0310 TaxID=2921429 RepID=UPI0030FADB06